jgi:hypothetical protein
MEEEEINVVKGKPSKTTPWNGYTRAHLWLLEQPKPTTHKSLKTITTK